MNYRMHGKLLEIIELNCVLKSYHLKQWICKFLLLTDVTANSLTVCENDSAPTFPCTALFSWKYEEPFKIWLTSSKTTHSLTWHFNSHVHNEGIRRAEEAQQRRSREFGGGMEKKKPKSIRDEQNNWIVSLMKSCGCNYYEWPSSGQLEPWQRRRRCLSQPSLTFSFSSSTEHQVNVNANANGRPAHSSSSLWGCVCVC